MLYLMAKFIEGTGILLAEFFTGLLAANQFFIYFVHLLFESTGIWIGPGRLQSVEIQPDMLILVQGLTQLPRGVFDFFSQLHGGLLSNARTTAAPGMDSEIQACFPADNLVDRLEQDNDFFGRPLVLLDDRKVFHFQFQSR